MHFHYMTNMSTAFENNPFPWIMKFSILVDPSLVIQYTKSVRSIDPVVLEKKLLTDDDLR